MKDSSVICPRRKEIARKPCVAAWRPRGGLPSAAMSRRSCLGGLASEALPEGSLVTLKSRGGVGGR